MVLGQASSGTKAVKLFGRQFRTERGATQGDPVSPIIFNILVDTVVRVIILEVCGPQEAHHRFGCAAGEHNIVFYVGGGCIEGSNPI